MALIEALGTCGDTSKLWTKGKCPSLLPCEWVGWSGEDFVFPSPGRDDLLILATTAVNECFSCGLGFYALAWSTVYCSGPDFCTLGGEDGCGLHKGRSKVSLLLPASAHLRGWAKQTISGVACCIHDPTVLRIIQAIEIQPQCSLTCDMATTLCTVVLEKQKSRSTTTHKLNEGVGSWESSWWHICSFLASSAESNVTAVRRHTDSASNYCILC